MRAVPFAVLAALCAAGAAQAQTTCTQMGAITTCQGADGMLSTTTRTGNITTTTRSDGLVSQTTDLGGMRTTQRSDGRSLVTMPSVGGAEQTRSSDGRSFTTTHSGDTTTITGSDGSVRHCRKMGIMTMCN